MIPSGADQMAFDIGRREFIAVLGGAAAAWPIAASAQQPSAMRRIGVLMGYAESDPEAQIRIQAFRQGLQDFGWQAGRNLQIDYRWARADVALIEAYAKELVALQPDAILANTTPVTAALKRETSTIPIVFVIVSDPVGAGFVASLSRPGGNITGFINVEDAMGGKWLELLKDIAPAVTRAAIMFNPNTAPGGGNYFFGAMKSAASALGVEASAAPVRSAAEIESTISGLASAPGSGLVISTDSFMTVNRKLIISLAERHRLPTVYPLSVYATDGGLIGYGPDYHDLFRRSAQYIDRVLRGAKPESLPVQVPTKFELAINLKTAKALGLTVPATLLAIADEVIE
jgi:putative ABC transport system substrate-binding protein